MVVLAKTDATRVKKTALGMNHTQKYRHKSSLELYGKYMHACMHACVCVCVCVRERERECVCAGMNLLSYFCIAVSAIQNHNCVAVFDFD